MANLTSLSIYFTFTATKTNCMKKLFLIVALLLSISIIAQTEKYHRVKIDISEKGIMELSKAGIAVDHGEYKKRIFFHF
jgi:hypothetical protein